MTAITEWGPEARTVTFSFYMTAHFCTRRTADALSAAYLADAITIAGPKEPNAADRLRTIRKAVAARQCRQPLPSRRLPARLLPWQ